MTAASDRADLHRERPLPGRERLEPRADGVVALRASARSRATSCRAGPRPGARRAPSRRRVVPGARGRRRLRLRCPNAPLQRGAQLARGGLGLGGAGDRAHDDDARRRPASATVADVARVEPADREPRLAHVRGRPLDVARARRPGAPAWSASRAPGRRPGSRRPRPPPPRRACSGACVERADDRVRRRRRARACGGRHVVLADVHAVGAARGHEVRPVVEHEQRAARRRRPRGTRARPRPARRRRAPCRAAARCPRRRAARRQELRAAARRRRGTAGRSRSRLAGRHRAATTIGTPLREPATGLRGRHRAADRRT